MTFNDKTLGQLVAENYKSADVFKSYGLDFCCGGNRNILSVCNDKGIDYQKISQELEAVLSKTDDFSDEIKNYELGQLIDYILDTHHTFVRNESPLIKQYLEKLVRVHGNKNSNLELIYNLFCKMSDELERHMLKEEQILFPYIKNLYQAKKESLIKPKAFFGTVNNPIRMMLLEHETTGEDLAKMSELTENYSIPDYACNTYKVTFNKLKDFQDDLLRHVHLENNILFPKAVKLDNDF